MELGERIQHVLEMKGMSQADLCRMTHLGSSKVSQVISGVTKDPRLSTIVPIAKALGVSLDYLAFGSSVKITRLDEWREQLNLNYEVLDEKHRIRLLGTSEMLVKSKMIDDENLLY